MAAALAWILPGRLHNSVILCPNRQALLRRHQIAATWRAVLPRRASSCVCRCLLNVCCNIFIFFVGVRKFTFFWLEVVAYYNWPKFKYQLLSGTGWSSYKILTKNSKTPMVNLLKNLRPFQNYNFKIQWAINFVTF